MKIIILFFCLFFYLISLSVLSADYPTKQPGVKFSDTRKQNDAQKHKERYGYASKQPGIKFSDTRKQLNHNSTGNKQPGIKFSDSQSGFGRSDDPYYYEVPEETGTIKIDKNNSNSQNNSVSVDLNPERLGTLYDSYGNLVQGSGAKVGKLLIKNKKDIKKNKELVKELQITLKLINYEDGAWGTYKTKYYKKIKAEMNIRGLYDDTTLENMSLFIQSRVIENLHQPGVTGPYYTSLSIEEVLEYAKKEINKFGVSDCYYLTKKENDPLCGKLAKDNSFFKKTINIVERK